MEEVRARRRHGRRSERLGPRGAGGGADLISALPEDLLVQILVRLRCARAAARTGLLSRRWRGLWTRLPDLILRGVPIRSIQAALGLLQGKVDRGVSLLDIAFTSLQFGAEVDSGVPSYEQVAAGVPSLLHAVAGISPVEFHLALPHNLERALAGVDLPRFHRATSIELYAPKLRLTLPRSSGGFPALERLSLRGCRVDLAALVLGCPCLHFLRVTDASLDAGINIQSESLQKLFVRTDDRWTDCIKVDAPMLQQLTLSFGTGAELSVSVVAPILEKVSWGCSYTTNNAGLAPWGLSKLRLYAAESLGRRVITGTGEDTCLQFSNVYVLSLQMTANGWFGAELNFVHHIQKHLVTNFSVLELIMVYDNGMGSLRHVFGPFVLHLLGMHQIRTTTRRLQIQLIRPEVKGKCPVNCPCDEPKNWRSKNISLINLEEVELKGFRGEDHEFDFLRVIFRCAPMLKRMSVRVSDEATTSSNRCTKIHEVFKEYPFVECNLMQR